VVDQAVAGEKHQAAAEQPRNQRSVTGRLRGRLVDEIERDCADQHSRAEAHDQANHAQGDADQEREDGADYERRRRQQPPTESRAHLVPRLRNL